MLIANHGEDSVSWQAVFGLNNDRASDHLPAAIDQVNQNGIHGQLWILQFNAKSVAYVTESVSLMAVRVRHRLIQIVVNRKCSHKSAPSANCFLPFLQKELNAHCSTDGRCGLFRA